MKVAVRTRYGGPGVIEIKDTRKPVPKGNEVLVKIYATTVNRTDDGFLRGKPSFARLVMGFPKPKAKILGCEFAGKVEKVGSRATKFRPGDKVFGYDDVKFGGHAEYKIISEDFMIEKIPAKMDYSEVAPALEGAHYCQFYIEAAKIQEGSKVLVYGASGSIGSAAVQIMSNIGVDVTAVCGTKNVDLVKSLGAKKVIDYEKQDYSELDEEYDVVFDAVGKSSFKHAKKVLKPNGIYTSTELGRFAQNPLLALTAPFRSGKKVLFPVPKNRPSDVAYIKRLMEKRAYRPVVDRKYSLEDIKDALEYVETGQKTGNVVIEINN